MKKSLKKIRKTLISTFPIGEVNQSNYSHKIYELFDFNKENNVSSALLGNSRTWKLSHQKMNTLLSPIKTVRTRLVRALKAHPRNWKNGESRTHRRKITNRPDREKSSLMNSNSHWENLNFPTCRMQPLHMILLSIKENRKNAADEIFSRVSDICPTFQQNEDDEWKKKYCK